MDHVQTFEKLTPHLILDAVEEAIGEKLTPLAHAHASYINRVYEVQTVAGERLIAKFYRPGRWSEDALLDEHDFVLDCEEEEIPVIAPIDLANDSTLSSVDQFFFAVYPKRWGRVLEVTDDDAWLRLGHVMARMHLAGQREKAEHRIVMHPAHSTLHDLNLLNHGGFVDPSCRTEFEALSQEALELLIPLFNDTELIRIHGDCHAANVLDRPDEGIMIIDFDDMAMGPPIQDLWMLLPGNKKEARHELDLVLEGYETIRSFDPYSLRLIEPLRLMRMLYFLAWSAMQADDPGFRQHFPDWGSYNFWSREITELRIQLHNIRDELQDHPSWM